MAKLIRCARAPYDPNLGPRFETCRGVDGRRYVELWALGRVVTVQLGSA